MGFPVAAATIPLCVNQTPVDAQNIRWLSHFYAFITFPDASYDRYVKRFVRDNLHYRGDIFCHAYSIVERLQEEAQKLFGSPTFYTYHIRRNDFQYDQVPHTARTRTRTPRSNKDTQSSKGKLLRNGCA